MRAKDNPFRSERILQVRYDLQDVTWADLLSRLERLSFKAAIVGPHGSGKTTLLEDFEPLLQDRGFNTWNLHLDEEHRAVEPQTLEELRGKLTSADMLLLDGAEQMNPVAWRWFCWITRKAGGLLITTHKPGRLPTLWQCRTTPDLLARIGSDLLGVIAPDIFPLAEMLFHKHQGNLRHALREWYDIVELPHNS